MKKYISKAAAWLSTKWYSLAAALSVWSMNTVKCLADDPPAGSSSGSSSNFWEDDGGGIIKMFDSIGSAYIKYAWFFGAISLVIWLWRPSGDKIGEACKKILIGVVVGYIVFTLGGAFMSSTFSEIGEWFK